MVNCRSSGLRVSTASGSTAAMLSAGGFPMPILSQDLQYMVREPIFPGAASSLVHGLVKSDQYIETTWFSKEGMIYIDGSHVCYSVQNGDTIEISSKPQFCKYFCLTNYYHRTIHRNMSCMCKTKTWVGDLSYKYLALQDPGLLREPVLIP
ncbi:nadh kinase [Quercus suber]|uniref:Nadh kinase n=1 Tax=Quercus suber TaxID=58331 RepID=A0AAW0IUI8_QUESU